MEAQKKQETPLKRTIRSFESKNMSDFKPSRKFYETVNIGQKRFGQLVRGDASPKVIELRRLSEFFNCDLMDLIN
jgi:hypothetical protein